MGNNDKNIKNLPCAWCGAKYYDRAHVPTKFLIPKADRNNQEWPILPSCKQCNEGLKLDEELFAVHFASALYGYSEIAQKVFDGPISDHLRKHRAIAARYAKYLSLVDLQINGKSQGVKTRIDISQDDWKRIEHVAEMFVRGLYYWHTKKSAKDLKAKIVYLTPKRFKNLIGNISTLKVAPLFPVTFEYAYGITEETGEAAFVVMIYNKPCFEVLLTTVNRHEKMEAKIKSGEIVPENSPGIEILG